jgi:Protein of unknown function (DUF3592)
MTARYLIPIAIPFVVGLMFLAATAVSFVSTARFLVGATTTRASFAGSRVRTGGNHGGAFHYPQFSFRTADGRDVTFTAKSGSTDQPYLDGQRVTVVYDPARPEQAELYSFWSLWAGTLFLAAFALPFTGIPAVVFVLTRHRVDPASQHDIVRGGCGPESATSVCFMSSNKCTKHPNPIFTRIPAASGQRSFRQQLSITNVGRAVLRGERDWHSLRPP